MHATASATRSPRTGAYCTPSSHYSTSRAGRHPAEPMQRGAAARGPRPATRDSPANSRPGWCGRALVARMRRPPRRVSQEEREQPGRPRAIQKVSTAAPAHTTRHPPVVGPRPALRPALSATSAWLPSVGRAKSVARLSQVPIESGPRPVPPAGGSCRHLCAGTPPWRQTSLPVSP